MVKKIFTYTLIAVLMVNLLAYQCVYVCFKIQQKRIAATLCVQKDVKANTCQGKCHLKKMVKKSEATSQKVQNEIMNDFICQDLPQFEMLAYALFMCSKPKTYGHPDLIEGCIFQDYSPPDFHFSA